MGINKNQSGIILPIDLLAEHGLIVAGVYSVLLSSCNDNYDVCITRQTIADKCKISVTSVKRAFTVLESIGIIKRICQKPKPNRYKIIPILSNNALQTNSEIAEYRKYKKVKLTEKQYESLIQDYGKDLVEVYIKKIDLHCQSTGKSYQDYAATIAKWIENDKGHYFDKYGKPITDEKTIKKLKAQEEWKEEEELYMSVVNHFEDW